MIVVRSFCVLGSSATRLKGGPVGMESIQGSMRGYLLTPLFSKGALGMRQSRSAGGCSLFSMGDNLVVL